MAYVQKFYVTILVEFYALILVEFCEQFSWVLN